jgi:hypothetical protein
MNLLRMPAAQLAVMGIALVTVSIRPGPAGATTAVEPPVAHATPAVQPPAHRARAAGSPRHRRHVHTVAVRRPLVRTVAVRRPPARPAHPTPPAPTGPTTWPALNAAIARIPTYHAGAARWIVSGRYGHWGTADWYHDTLYISPSVPTTRLYDVAVHEWSHELSVLDYNGDVDAAVKVMNHYFGGGGLTGAERAADCMAVLQGAGWTHYTSCTDARWRAGARALMRGGEL